MTNLIRALVPSFHSSDHPTRDLSALLRPVNLRGLAPDHTLVLMNNKRRHRGCSDPVGFQRRSNGAQGPDIRPFPPSPSSAWRCCATGRPPSTGLTPSPGC